jgi:ribosome-binding protein aMBF1 (putative translation factor)
VDIVGKIPANIQSTSDRLFDKVQHRTQNRIMARKMTDRLGIDGDKLTSARLGAKLSGELLGKAVGCDKASISRWERNKVTPADEIINRLAKVLGTRDFIVEGEVK